VFTLAQVRDVVAHLDAKTPAYVSVFAGRIADTGRDPMPLMAAARALVHTQPHAELIWASPRELLYVFHAEAVDCDIITVTNDVLALKSGTGLFAAALTAKGKIVADVRIFCRPEDFLVDTSMPAGPGFAALLRKFVNPRFAKFADVTPVMRTVGVFGPEARALVIRAFDLESDVPSGLVPYQHVMIEVEGTRALIAAVPDLGVSGFDLFVPVEAAPAVWSRLASAGGVRTGTAAAEIARVEAGRPLWGADMDETTLAAEANLDALGGISYTKGCYTGQETVARLHFRGHVNRSLRGLRSPAAIPAGAQLYSAEGNACGDVRSSVVSPRHGPIALATIRREVAAGDAVTARWEGGEAVGQVTELPFP